MRSCCVTGIGPSWITLVSSVDRNSSLGDGVVGPTEVASCVWSHHTLTILTSMRWECEGSRKASDAVFPLKTQHLPQPHAPSYSQSSTLSWKVTILTHGGRATAMGDKPEWFSPHPPAHPPCSAIDSATHRNVWSFSSSSMQRLRTVLKIDDNSPLLLW